MSAALPLGCSIRQDWPEPRNPSARSRGPTWSRNSTQNRCLACMRHLPTGPRSLATIPRSTGWRNRNAQSSDGEIVNRATVACCGTSRLVTPFDQGEPLLEKLINEVPYLLVLGLPSPTAVPGDGLGQDLG